MKKIVWIFCLVIGICANVHAQGNLQQQVERTVQNTVEKQDYQWLDKCTESYLNEAKQHKKPLVITRDGQDSRKLYLLGDVYLFEKAEELGEGVITNNYVNSQGNQSIFISTRPEKTVEEVLVLVKKALKATAFKLQTYAPLNTTDGMITFTTETNQGVNYIAFRVFQGANGKIFITKVTRMLGSYNVTVMRGIYQALKQTNKNALTAHFVETTCQMGADCY